MKFGLCKDKKLIFQNIIKNINNLASLKSYKVSKTNFLTPEKIDLYLKISSKF